MPRIPVGTDAANSIELHYEEHGTGAPVVLIHGWPLSGKSWEHQVPALVEAGYRVIAYDRRGFGDSSQPSGGYDYDTFADDLKAVLDTLELDEVTLVGFSMGGGEVARYIGTYGEDRIAKAVLAGSVTPYLYKADDNPEGGLDDAAIGEMEDGVRSDRQTFLDGFTKKFFAAGEKTDLISDEARQASVDIAMAASPQATQESIGAFARTDFRDDLTKISVPTLVIHGDSDGIVPFDVSGRRAAEAIESSTLVVIEGAPHGFNATHAEEFNRALLEFLRS